VAIIPEPARSEFGDVVSVPLEPRRSRNLGLAWSTERSLPASVSAFLDHNTAERFGAA
jgi:DNA-binding transcriptional LysR family regulator